MTREYPSLEVLMDVAERRRLRALRMKWLRIAFEVFVVAAGVIGLAVLIFLAR